MTTVITIPEEIGLLILLGLGISFLYIMWKMVQRPRPKRSRWGNFLWGIGGILNKNKRKKKR